MLDFTGSSAFRIAAVWLAFLIASTEGFFLLGATAPSSSSSSSASPWVRVVAPLSGSTAAADEEQDALEALERLGHLDAKFGEGCGAGKERARLQQRVERWWQSVDDEQDRDDDDDFGEAGGGEETEDGGITGSRQCNDRDGPFVDRHGANERVAIFGGDPARRRQTVEKRLRPYRSLHQFGTPRDVGGGQGRDKIVQRIRHRSFDVVYIWTRFGCHSSRGEIREACRFAGTRCVEIESLSRIQKQKEQMNE